VTGKRSAAAGRPLGTRSPDAVQVSGIRGSIRPERGTPEEGFVKGIVGRVLVPAVAGGLAALLVFVGLQIAVADRSRAQQASLSADVTHAAEPVPAPMTATVISPQPRSTDPGRVAAPGSRGRFVSLTAHERQVIPSGVYTQLRFDGEQTDRPRWHRAGSTLIVPTRTAVALVCYKVTWSDDDGPTQYYAQIARDPDGVIDVTGAEDAANNPGRDYRALCWTMMVRKGQPLAIRVRHDGPEPTTVDFAEFKVWLP
jgi:hypothetical protein